MNEVINNYGFIESLSIIELIATPIYLMIILFWGYVHQQKMVKKYPHYKHFLTGLIIKIIGGLGFCFVYIKVYKGGDTVNYFESARAFSNLLVENSGDFITNFFSSSSHENYFRFSPTTGYPWAYMYYDPKTLLVIKIATPIVIISFNSFLLSTLLFSVLSYFGIWKAYEIFIQYYPQHKRNIFYSFIALPSVVFWGSGILKDTITLSATCWFFYFFHSIFIVKKYELKSVFGILIATFVILFIKSYILLSLMPGVIFWLSYNRISKISSRILKLLSFPIIIIVSVGGGFTILSLIGEFNFESLIKEASVKQNDLKQSYYNGSSFDIGTYEPTIAGALKVAPKALYASLYRPTFLDAKNPQMILSALENFILIAMSIWVVFKNRFFGVFKLLFDNPILLFSLSYSILLAVLIGLSTANFGALIRFKIAFAPFFATTIMQLYTLSNRKKTI